MRYVIAHKHNYQKLINLFIVHQLEKYFPNVHDCMFSVIAGWTETNYND